VIVALKSPLACEHISLVDPLQTALDQVGTTPAVVIETAYRCLSPIRDSGQPFTQRTFLVGRPMVHVVLSMKVFMMALACPPLAGHASM